MAFCRTEFCEACGLDTMHTNHKCNRCMLAKVNRMEDAWEALTPEEKMKNLLRRVERLEGLERVRGGEAY